jgi:hypothetical protein
MKLKTHDFEERLHFSEQASHEDFWLKVYKKAFPDMLWANICIGNNQNQKLGIDRVIQLSSGKTIYIDEKKRGKIYSDILLEYISVDYNNTPGWIEKDLQIDYLAYAFMPSKQCYIFPWQLLKRVWNHFKHDWHAKYPKIPGKNKTYTTWSRAIPINVLTNKLQNSMLIKVD